MQLENQKQTSRSPQYSAMRRVLTELQGHSQAWAFQQPVNGDEVTDYYSVIKEPMGTLLHTVAFIHPVLLCHSIFSTLSICRHALVPRAVVHNPVACIRRIVDLLLILRTPPPPHSFPFNTSSVCFCSHDLFFHLGMLRTTPDFRTMEHKLEDNQYADMEALVKDANLVFKNCRTYNQEASTYVRSANTLEAFLKELLEDVALT